ncbi:MAG: hypothetical protein IME98_06680 [Proteobacteria bacterium]|nr:hypothetical protein [Pseudomonadota bacterium]
MDTHREEKLQAARLLISNAIHALDSIDDMPATKDQLYNTYNEIKDAQDVKNPSSRKANANKSQQISWSESVKNMFQKVERWKNISALR